MEKKGRHYRSHRCRLPVLAVLFAETVERDEIVKYKFHVRGNCFTHNDRQRLLI